MSHISAISGLRRLLLPLGVMSASLLGALQTKAETLYLLTEDGLLSSVSTTAATITPTVGVLITGVTSGETLVAIDVRPQNQQLYALGVNNVADKATLYLVEPSNGVATPVGTAGQIAFTTNGALAVDFPDAAAVKWDIDFNPTADRVRVVAGKLTFRINPNTGAGVDGDNGGVPVIAGTNPDGTVNGGSLNVNSAAYTNNQPNDLITTLYTLDDVSNSLFIQNPPNAGTQTLVLAVTLGGPILDFSQSSFDIASGVNAPASNAPVAAGTGFMVAKIAGGTSKVYTLNLVSAQATLLGDTGLAVRSVAVRTDLGAAIAMNSAGTSLLRFNPATPGTVTISPAISGLTAGETLVGIDNRPQTGQLYGLGINAVANTGTLYLIDPQTGAISAVGAAGSIAFVDATAATVDLPDPVSGYGFDFNPTVDRIRVITGTGLNFRINPGTGAPVDGDLGGAAGSVPGTNTDGNQVLNGLSNSSTGSTGAAYTNSVAQSLSGGVTTLYTLDSTSSSIYLQNPPNAGTTTTRVPITIGGAIPTFPALGGFDIPNTVVVAASNTVAVGEGWFIATVSGLTNLYRIDLTTGKAVSFGAVGAGATQMAGLAVFSVEPDLSVQNPPGTELVDNAGTIAFGTTFAGAPGTPVTATVTLRNVGSQPLTYSTSLDTGTQFSVTTNGTGVIAGTSSTVLTLTFNPTTTGAKTDVLHILSNDPQIASFEIALTGTGVRDISVENPTGTIVVDNASTIDFGTTYLGSPVTATFTVRNLGSQPLIYSTTFTTGTQYSATSNGSGSIPGTSSTVVTLTFNPTLTGTLTDTLHILSNDPEIPSFEIALTGKGFAKQLDDFLLSSNGATRLKPLANDPLSGTLTIVAVSDPAIIIDGRTLIIPSNYVGSFTYTISNGVVLGQSTVTVSANLPSVAPKTFNGVLTDATGKVVGWAKAAVSAKGTGSIRVVVASGGGAANGSGKLAFPVGFNVTSTGTQVGTITVDRQPGGDIGVYGVSLALTGGGTLTGLLHAEKTADFPVIYHLELASIDPTLAGGGWSIATVTRNASVRILGVLPDGNQFTGTSVLTDNDDLAFYFPIGRNPSGVVGGELTLGNNVSTDITGEFVWSKPSGGVKGTERFAVDTVLTANGSLFDRTIPLYTGGASLALTGGNLLLDELNFPSITNGLPDGLPAVPIGSVVTWKSKSGVGTFVFNVVQPSGVRVAGTGIYLQKSSRAFGYFPGPVNGGRVVVTP